MKIITRRPLNLTSGETIPVGSLLRLREKDDNVYVFESEDKKQSFTVSHEHFNGGLGFRYEKIGGNNG